MRDNTENNSSSLSLKRNLAEMVKESAWSSLLAFDDVDSSDEYDDDECTTTTAETIGELESDEETEIAHALVEKAFLSQATTKTPTATSSPVFDIMFRSFIAEQSSKKAKKMKLSHDNSGLKSQQYIRMSVSEPHLPTLASQQQQPLATRRSLSNTTSSSNYSAQNRHIAPHVYLHQRWASSTTSTPPQLVSFRDVPDSFFCPLEPCHIRAYDNTLVRAVRDQDVEALLRIHKNNGTSTLHAGNKFGETILHAACRRGATAIVRVLMDQGEHPVRVCCQSGRTVLHDAAWTCTPHWNVMNTILQACPDLLYIQDDRGNTPLEYVPRDQWSAWCEYLDTCSLESLRPRILK